MIFQQLASRRLVFTFLVSWLIASFAEGVDGLRKRQGDVLFPGAITTLGPAIPVMDNQINPQCPATMVPYFPINSRLPLECIAGRLPLGCPPPFRCTNSSLPNRSVCCITREQSLGIPPTSEHFVSDCPTGVPAAGTNGRPMTCELGSVTCPMGYLCTATTGPAVCCPNFGTCGNGRMAYTMNFQTAPLTCTPGVTFTACPVGYNCEISTTGYPTCCPNFGTCKNGEPPFTIGGQISPVLCQLDVTHGFCPRTHNCALSSTRTPICCPSYGACPLDGAAPYVAPGTSTPVDCNIVACPAFSVPYTCSQSTTNWRVCCPPPTAAITGGPMLNPGFTLPPLFIPPMWPANLPVTTAAPGFAMTTASGAGSILVGGNAWLGGGGLSRDVPLFDDDSQSQQAEQQAPPEITPALPALPRARSRKNARARHMRKLFRALVSSALSCKNGAEPYKQNGVPIPCVIPTVGRNDCGPTIPDYDCEPSINNPTINVCCPNYGLCPGNVNTPLTNAAGRVITCNILAEANVCPLNFDCIETSNSWIACCPLKGMCPGNGRPYWEKGASEPRKCTSGQQPSNCPMEPRRYDCQDLPELRGQQVLCCPFRGDCPPGKEPDIEPISNAPRSCIPNAAQDNLASGCSAGHLCLPSTTKVDYICCKDVESLRRARKRQLRILPPQQQLLPMQQTSKYANPLTQRGVGGKQYVSPNMSLRQMLSRMLQ